MMTILLYVALALVGMYLLAKIGLFFYRPIVINKAMLEIKDGFARVMKAHDEEINIWMKHLENYRKGEKAETFHFSSEDEISKRIKDAVDAKEHEREVYEKLVKLRERSLNDKKKLAEAMRAYTRYLVVCEGHLKAGKVYRMALEIRSMTWDQFMTSAREGQTTIAEAERQLDVMLRTS